MDRFHFRRCGGSLLFVIAFVGVGGRAQAQPAPVPALPVSSYLPVKIDEPFDAIERRMAQAKPAILEAHGKFLAERYDLADRPADRVSAVDASVVGADPDFSDRELNLNLLARWEFRPGSTLFLVWTHARSAAAVTPFALGHDLRQLWRAPAVNALQAKISYWIGS